MLSLITSLCGLVRRIAAAYPPRRARRPRNGSGHRSAILWRATEWRSVKYEEVYLRAYTTGSEARGSLTKYFAFYNERRVHETLAYATPDEVYFAACEPTLAIAA